MRYLESMTPNQRSHPPNMQGYQSTLKIKVGEAHENQVASTSTTKGCPKENNPRQCLLEEEGEEQPQPRHFS